MRSSSAFSTHWRASSARVSRRFFIEHLALKRRRAFYRAGYVLPFSEFSRRGHHHIHRHPEIGERHPNRDACLALGSSDRHHNKKVKVAVAPRRPARVRAEEYHLVGMKSPHNPARHPAGNLRHILLAPSHSRHLDPPGKRAVKSPFSNRLLGYRPGCAFARRGIHGGRMTVHAGKIARHPSYLPPSCCYPPHSRAIFTTAEARRQIRSGPLTTVSPGYHWALSPCQGLFGPVCYV